MKVKITLYLLTSLMTFHFMLSSKAQAGEPVVPQVREYDLSVIVDVTASRISGVATMKVNAGQPMVFTIGKLSIVSVTLNDQDITTVSSPGKVTVSPDKDGVLAIRYEGEFRDGENARDADPKSSQSMIDAQGVFLSSAWYPQLDALATYHLRLTLPRGYEALSEAEKIEKSEHDKTTEFRFLFEHPSDGIHVVASDRYEVFRDRLDGIDLYAYFYPEERELAKTYLVNAKKLLEQYGAKFTNYPFARYSIVEGFLPRGLSMATVTILGQDAVRSQPVVGATLTHGVLHQWFRNLVHVDYAKGNWAEGLTTYLADLSAEEEQGRGALYRKQLLIEYGAYVHAGNEISLREFKGRKDPASRAIGYGKGAMVFHMLHTQIGEEKFNAALAAIIRQHQHQRASWDDLRAAFELQTRKDLAPFFKQWVDEKGIVNLIVENVNVRRADSAFEISFEVNQKGSVRSLDLQIEIFYLRGGTKKELLKLEAAQKKFTLTVEEEPSKMVIDSGYDLARRPTVLETPPSLARALGDEKPLVVLPVANKEHYDDIVAWFKERGAEAREAEKVKDADMKTSSLVILGADNPLIGRLYGALAVDTPGFSVLVRNNPWNAEKTAAIFHATTKAEALAALPLLSRYGRYGSLTFVSGRNVSRMASEAELGMVWDLRTEAQAVDLRSVKVLSDVIKSVADKQIIYVGEFHDRFAHHNVQLQIIRSLFKKDPKLVVGMEMFPLSSQKVLDDYVSGAINERDFIKQSEYFKRWGFEYSLYKPILDFARAEKTPIVGLNIRREITDKVSKSGMDELTDDERKEVPSQMDFSDDEYRARLKDVFDQHEARQGRSFDAFYEAQIIWDETMARTLSEFLAKNPDRHMIVLAGGGHIAFGSGIPKRAFRRNGLSYATVLIDSDMEPGVADYIVYPQALDGVLAPKLMVMLKDTQGVVSVLGFGKDSVAQRSGMQTGDIIVSLDSDQIHSVEDLKLALQYKKHEQTVKVLVKRKRFLLRDKEMEIEVKL